MTDASPTRPRVLVTGASRGIGLELVRQYAADGWDVVATCRDPDAAADLRAIAAAHGDAVGLHRLDVTSNDHLEQLAEQLGDTPIDVLISNAAIFGGTRSRFPDVDYAAWSDTFAVNTIGALRVPVRLWQNVAAGRERKIVFLSSRAGLPREAAPNRSYLYGSSKAALNSAARLFALDVASQGVIAALVNPGHVQTGIGGARARMTPAESVTKVRAVIRALTPADAGKFLHYDGTELKL